MMGRRQQHPTPALLPGKSHGRRSLVGCSPWGRYVGHDWATSLSRIGEGNGNPRQCSCLENPRDGGTWWAAVYGVAQSRTWLKWLSSSSIWWKMNNHVEYSTDGTGKTDSLTGKKKKKSDPYLTPYITINSYSIKDLNKNRKTKTHQTKCRQVSLS